MENIFILGVTGVIGSGKSTLCEYLAKEHGFFWIDTDKIVHELYKKDAAGYMKIKDYFGSQFVGERQVHRGRLRRFILKNPQRLWILNQCIHPLVMHEVNKKIVQLKRQNKSKLLRICLEALYFEQKDFGRFIDALWLVDAPDALIHARVQNRHLPDSDLYTFIKFQRRHLAQIPDARTIINDNERAAFLKKVDEFVLQLPA